MDQDFDPREEGTVLEIQRLSTEDGPGIRTTVFFKGCGLRCLWCHNPESIAFEPELQWLAPHCLGCGTCLSLCPRGALSRDTTQAIRIDRARCKGCGRCAQACPASALEVLGRRIEAAELVRELEKDRAYFEKSGGGVTLSGGEAALQPRFALAVLGLLRERGIRTALDSCGFFPEESLRPLAAATDLVLFDIKQLDGDLHKRYTGAPNERILSNLRLLASMIREGRGPALWIRTPVIPGATADVETISRIAAYMAAELAGVPERWELCAFNNLCKDKYARLGIVWDYADRPVPSRAHMEELVEAARALIDRPKIVSWTGQVREGVA